MTAEFELYDQKIVIDNDGDLTMPGHDIEADIIAVELGDEPSPLLKMYEAWGAVVEQLKEENQWDSFLDEVARGIDYWPRFSRYADWTTRQHRDFGLEDFMGVFIEALKYHIKEENEGEAVDIASVIKGFPLHTLSNMPQVTVESYEEESPDGILIKRIETHKLEINEEEVAEWEQWTNIEIDSVFLSISQNDYREYGGFDELDPSPIVQAVLDALGLEDEEPDYPDEELLGIPDEDQSGKGLFGILYEKDEYKYQPSGAWTKTGKKEAEIVIYDEEYTAKEAMELVKSVERSRGKDDFDEITLVRRMTPSEIEKLAPPEEQPQNLHPLWLEWTELEEDWRDRPEDFDE